MKQWKRPADVAKPVSRAVQDVLHMARADMPHSDDSEAQMTEALTWASQLAAARAGAEPPRPARPLQRLLGLGGAKKSRRRWFSSAPAMPDARRIQQMLDAAQTRGARLSYDDPV